MYLLITVIAALLVGLVLVALVQTTFGQPEEAVGTEDSDGPRFRVVRRGYDIAEVDRYLDALQDKGHERSTAQE